MLRLIFTVSGKRGIMVGHSFLDQNLFLGGDCLSDLRSHITFLDSQSDASVGLFLPSCTRKVPVRASQPS